ncbi:uncharacterized protein BJ212DRAFT_1316309 [Suillus subaureus]|uniref:Uncharacterized protein n=1 Tax=Suillus subaureus TaxID=48587 RepID=A0A9P7EM59_9AGAM|nr:uncharacterized protein BJ212DRAFT_1316309 [Suillus subaureus]KAG1825812.1 hypothetical protein BJ212DRAFT_1316309 [Suillus subaureus]
MSTTTRGSDAGSWHGSGDIASLRSQEGAGTGLVPRVMGRMLCATEDRELDDVNEDDLIHRKDSYLLC